MILGQSAAAAARIAVRQEIPVQDVDYDILRPELMRLGQVLELERGQNPSKKPG